MQFTGHSLLVHHSEVGPSSCPILSAEHTCMISFDYLPLDVSLPLSSEWQVWSSSSGNNYHAVHRCITFFYGTVRIFTLSHIVSKAVFYSSPSIDLTLLFYVVWICIWLCGYRLCPLICIIFIWVLHYHWSAPISSLYFSLFFFFISSLLWSVTLSAWSLCLLCVAPPLILICWWGITSKSNIMYTFYFWFIVNFFFYYLLGLNRESVRAQWTIQPLTLRVSYWLNLELFWSSKQIHGLKLN